MASKDNKTSKTARVMNLLSKKQDPAAADEKTAAAPAAAVPPIVSSLAPDAAISAQIKDALEGELGGLGDVQAAPVQAQAEPAPAVEEPPAGAAQPAPQAAPAQPEAAPEPEPVQAETAQPQTQPEPVSSQPEAAAQPGPAPQPEATAAPEVPDGSKFFVPEHPGYMNVMQVLVEEKAEKYIKMFGLCTCERCLEDVKALTLNNLPPKYVVLEKGDWISRLTVYEGKYTSDITAQLLHACQVVMQTPHHSR